MALPPRSAPGLHRLLDASRGPQSVTSDSFKGMGSLQIIMDANSDVNLPQPLYWSVSEEDPTPTTIQFPALLDMNAPHTQVGPYFNSTTNKPITIEEFTKMKATFAVLPLPDNPDLYSQEAIECSKRTTEFLESLAQDTEVERNTYLRVSKRNLTSWNNVDKYNHTIALKLQTEVLFTAPGEEHGATTANTLPDPILRYKNLFKSEPELAGYKVISPSIKGHNGSIIAPGDYLDKLRDAHLTPVCVEVIPRIWEIQPAKLSKKPAKRIYQLLIKSVQLLPIKKKTPPLPSRIPTSSTPQSPLKRKPDSSDEMEVSPRNKRKV